GTRGPGEQKIEAERRRYKEKIGQLTKELEKISRQRVIRRSLRIKKNIPTVAIVGYTNAGKSTLLNALTGAHAYVEDRMFATLDPSTRKAFIPGLGNIIFSDTVGFIREMPKTLLDAFRATLDEIKDADLILEVIDLSDPNYSAHFHIINKTLQDLEVEGIPVIVVLNKIDRLDAPPALEHEITSAFPVVFLSSQQKTGFEQLYILMKTALQENCQVIQLVVDYSELPSVEKEIYRSGYIENMKTLPDGRIQIVCIVQKEVAEKIWKTLRQPSLSETSSHPIK
ncbi:MAG: GTPase HflX, partial [Atribacterota bacterium]